MTGTPIAFGIHNVERVVGSSYVGVGDWCMNYVEEIRIVALGMVFLRLTEVVKQAWEQVVQGKRHFVGSGV